MNALKRAHSILLNQRGVSLTELMIAAALIGIGVIAGINAFGSIQESIQSSKARTLATNLAQEKIQILKQQSYNRLMVSTGTAYRTDLNPNVPYDPYYYVPETILEGGVMYTRLTYVEVVQEDSGNIIVLPPTTPDTGMKLVTVTAIWRLGQENHSVQVRAIDSNPNTVMSNAILRGVVRSSAPSPALIQNAVVTIAENVGWRDTSSASGAYAINLSPGTYNAVATADGYYSSVYSFTIIGSSALVKDFYMFPISSGTVKGSAWINDHLVLTQVVGSTQDVNGFYQEYVEVFNPSTFTWTIATGPSTPVIDLKYQIRGGSLITIQCDYNTLTIAPGGYYLFANTGTVTAVGVARTADAVFSSLNTGYPNIIKINSDSGYDASGVGLAYTSGGAWIDRVGWKSNSQDPPVYEGTPIDQNAGLESDEQYVRRSSTSGVVSGHGRAYDTQSNAIDLMTDGRQPMIYPPRNSSDVEAIVSGTPAYGAIVTVTDGLSAGATAYSQGFPPYAEFMIPGVATGTWSVFVSSSGRLFELANLNPVANTTTWVPHSGTSPTWPASGSYAAILSSVATSGFVSGRITNATGGTISGITVAASGYSPLPANANGNYLLSVAPGDFIVTANPANANASYVAMDYPAVAVSLGEVTAGINFVLSQGGRIRAYVTRDGLNALSGVSVAAYDANGTVVDENVSGNDGYVTLVNLSTGAYTVQTVLDAGEISSPLSAAATVTVGSTIFASTFTISGAYGAITGNVTTGGSIIKKGVLVIVSTSSISSTPPTLSTTTLTGAGYYSNSSLEDGSYRVEVRGSTTTAYRVHGYYFTFNGSTPVISTSVVTGVTVTAGVTTSGINLTW